MVRVVCCIVSPWKKGREKTVLYWFGAKTRKVKTLSENNHKKKGEALRDRSIGNQVLLVLHFICLYFIPSSVHHSGANTLSYPTGIRGTTENLVFDLYSQRCLYESS